MANSDFQSDLSVRDENNRNAVDQSDLLERLGIQRVPVDEFRYGGYRYSNATDAIAEARRRPGNGA